MNNRIREWRERRRLTQGQLADAVRPATTAQQISRLERGDVRLSQGWMERLSAILGCQPSELLPAIDADGNLAAEERGIETARQAHGLPPVTGALPLGGGFVEGSGTIPVIAMAACGIKGWYAEERLAVSTPRPAGLDDGDAFAVIATGESMIPAGILPGFLCLCSPGVPPALGDAVFIEREDGVASIKIFDGVRKGWLALKGWLPEDDKGRREPYLDRVRPDSITRIAPVVYVKRRL